jgi:diguanylate cyclase (GGDEF)-like protein/PAS domain S-box-containing protein
MLPTLPLILGVVALIGWALDISILKQGTASSIAMNPVTAVCFIFAGFEAIRLHARNNVAFISRAGQLVVFLVIIASGMMLSDLMFGTSFSIDTQLFSTKLAAESGYPSRMAPNTAFSFFVLGLSMQFLRGRSDSSVLAAQLLAMVSSLSALLVIAGYTYGIKAFYGIDAFIPMAINTAVSFLFLSVSVLFTYPDKGFMRVLTSDGHSGSIASILLPAAVLVPFVFGWLSFVGQREGLYDMGFALALTVVMNIAVLLFLTYIGVRRLFLSDSLLKNTQTELRGSAKRTNDLNVANDLLQEEILKRERMSEAVRLDNDFRKEMINSLPGVFYMLDSSGRYLLWNRNLESVLHCSSEEIARSHPLEFFEGTDCVLIEENIRKVFEAGETSVEAVLVARNGTKTPYLFTGRCIDRDGEPVLVGLGIDIAGRKQNEQELRVAAIAFETHEAIMITGPDDRIIRVNKAFERITGYSADEVIGHTPHMLSSGKHDQAFYEAMWQQIASTGQWEGEIWDKRKNGDTYPKWLTVTAVRDAGDGVSNYVGVFSDISQRKLAEEEIYSLAYYDTLTKLPNRRLLQDRFGLALAVSERSGSYGVVLFLDLDKFKTLNDTLGHGYGDLLLIEVAARIKAGVREMDTVARMGGDEFVVLIEEVSSDAEEATQKAAHIAEKIRSALAQSYFLEGHEQHSSPSIGVCLYRGRAESVESLLKHADMAMYQAKASGRNTVCFFDPVMQQAVEGHAALEADLRRAVSLQQLRLYYQIQLDNEHRPLGAEALLRWIHPTRGMVLPAQFIPLAEETMLILEIGHWVLETACRQLKLWEQHARTRDLTIAINVSAQQFAMPDFVGQVAEVLRKHRVIPARLKLELTETVVLDDVQGTVGIMHALKGLGVGLSMDDFGTGYSSLSYLKLLPLDQLKIDQSFVRDITSDPNDAVLVQTIIDMARNFRLNVIAEGVETEAQLAFLKQHGCMAYQGYLFSKPVPLEEFEALLGGM